MSKFHAIYSKGGDTHGEVQTLLWTNPNTRINFDGKKIEIDLSNYEGVIVEFLDNASQSVQNLISRTKIEKNISYANGGGFVSLGVSGVARNITAVDNTGITIGNAFNSTNENNGFVIPYKIYGYKQYEAGPEPEPSTNKLVYLGVISSTLNIAAPAQAAGLNTSLMNQRNFMLVPKNWTINASGGSKVNEEKTESGANTGNYGITYSTATAILTISNQPNCNIQGGQAFATSNAIVTFDVYYFTGEI